MGQDSFAIRLLRAQSLRKMSQAQLSVASGINHCTISNLQSGIRSPNMTTLVKLARALQVSADYLCGLKESYE